MNFFYDSHKTFIIELIRYNVEFLLVGGYAVIFHGYGRTTSDLDIWVNATENNKEKLILCLRSFGIHEDDLKLLAGKNFKDATAFHIGEYPERIDFLTKMVGLNFNEAFLHRVFLNLENHQVPFIHINDLLANKLISGRQKDMADVEELQKIMRLKRKD